MRGLFGCSRMQAARSAEAEIEDQLTGARTTVRARVFVNCTGPYSDHIREMATPGSRTAAAAQQGCAHPLATGRANDRCDGRSQDR